MFRADELAERLGEGISERTVKEACRLWVQSGGCEGLAHSEVGKGFLIRAEAVDDWLKRMERQRAGETRRRRRAV